MSTSRHISTAENILLKIKNPSNPDYKSEVRNFIKIMNEIFLNFLDEYNLKFRLEIKHVSFEKFKTVAKKTGNINAINFLIWYEKEYKKLKNEPEIGMLLEKEVEIPPNQNDATKKCSMLLDEIKKLIYYAYEIGRAHV